MQETLPLNNVPEFSVSELAFSLKKTIEDTYGRVRLRGELGRLTFHSSGHLYGNIKDDKSTIDIVCWRGNVSKLSVRPEEGIEVICTGKMSSFPARSNYQFQIESMELAGEGALLKMLEMRKKKLAAEGLFDQGRKKELPFLPQSIGVITSPTGAVIRDILHRIRERFPMPVQLYPVRVQGETAAGEVLQAIRFFTALYHASEGQSLLEMGEKVTVPRGKVTVPSVLILARGGGTLEDLMPFNDEAVVRAVAECPIPIISAIGHETDTTLVDYAADLRAPTPTGAAEMAVPVRANLRAQVMDDAMRLDSAVQRQMDYAGQKLRAARLKDPQAILEMKGQGLDHSALRLSSSFDKYLARKKEQASRIGAGLRHPKHGLEEKKRQLALYQGQFERLAPVLTKQKKQELDALGRMLETLSFKSVLARGYVVVRDAKNGDLVSDARKITSDQTLELQFKDDKRIKVTSA